VEIRVKLGDSETIWSRILSPIRFARSDGTGKVSYVLFSAVEVTDQVRAREQLERLAFLKDPFLALARHELRTPLVPLTGYSEALLRLVSKPPAEGKEDERNQRILQMVNKFRGQINHLVRLTDDLLDVSRLQSGKFSLRDDLVALTGVVNQAIEETRLTAPKRVIRLEQTEKDQQLMVRGDEGRLLQALNNVLNNAIKHATQSDRIDVRLSRANTNNGAAHAQIEVRDYGPGIAPENLGRIFNRFNQISTDGLQPKGLGLGLYIAKGIIEQ